MATNLDASLRVSLHASEDLRRSLTSDFSPSSSTRMSKMSSSWREGQSFQGSRSSGVSLWGSTISSNTWPRSPRSASGGLVTGHFRSSTGNSSRFRSSLVTMTSSCLLHAHGESPDVCPFDGSKYRLKPLPRLSPLSSPAASVCGKWGSEGRPFSGMLENSQVNRYDSHYHHDPLERTENGLDDVMAELEEVFHCSRMSTGSSRKTASSHLNAEATWENGPDRGITCNARNTQLNGDLWYLNRSVGGLDSDSPGYWTAEESFLDKTSSCRPREIQDNGRNVSYSYGNLYLSSSKFPSRVSLQSAGSNELCTSGRADNSKAATTGRRIRMEIEAKYEQYKETYLATSPEQELQILNTGIVNVRKWLRKRHTYLTQLKSSSSDSNKLKEDAALLKKLITEAKKQQEGVDVLLDRGQRFLAVRANIVLEVDLENLVFLWNTYVENLRKLQEPLASQNTIKKVKSDVAIEAPESSLQVVPISKFEEAVSCKRDSEREAQTLKEEISIEVKDKDSNSGGSSSSVDVSRDVSFQDPGRLTLEDLKTTNTALDISELVHNKASDLSVATHVDETTVEAENCSHLQQQHEVDDEVDSEDDGGNLDQADSTNLLVPEISDSQSAVSDQSGINKMEVEFSETCPDVVYPDDDAISMPSPTDVVAFKALKVSSSGDCPPSPITPEVDEKEDSICNVWNGDAGKNMESLVTFESPAAKVSDRVPGNESVLSSDLKRRRGLLEAPVANMSNQSSRSESPLSLDSSRSETPTGTLRRAERQNELWRAIGSIDTFLMDKDIIEACKSTAGDLTSEDEDCAGGAGAAGGGGAPNVSFAEFLQQYRELTDWLNQVHKVTQRELTSLSEKYLNQSYQEEMLERSPRREFLNNYSRQLLRRYPGLGEQIGARMARLNAQWAALERTVAPPHGLHDADTMLKDLESDLSELRRWLNAIEARLLPLTIKADWSDAELEQRLQRHKVLQRDIESHNKIVNAVLKLSERLSSQGEQAGGVNRPGVKEERERECLQLVALNLQRRWHGIWLQSLEWQCRLEDALTRRKGLYQGGFDFSGYSLPVLDESLFGESSHRVSDQGLIELDDDSLLFVGHRADFVELDDYQRSCDTTLSDSRSGSASPCLHAQGLEEQEEFGALWSPDVSDGEEFGGVPRPGNANSSSRGALDPPCLGAATPVGLSSPPRPIPPGRVAVDSPLGKRPYPDQTPGDASPAKRGSQSPLSSSGGASPVTQENPLDNFISSRGLCINQPHHHQQPLTLLGLKSSRSLFDHRSSGDSANISECESKMGDSPPVSLNHGSSPDVGGRRGEGENHDTSQSPPVVAKVEVKDVGYSSESQSNDEIEMMRHQIDLEYKFPGKCEVATDGPLGEKVLFPSVGVRPDYYCMTHVELDSTTTSDVTDSSGERGGVDVVGTKTEYDNKDSKKDYDGDRDSLGDSWGRETFSQQALAKGHFGEKELLTHEGRLCDQRDSGAAEDTMVPMHQLADFSESDSAPEGGKKSIRYLIDHAEDLVKPGNPKSPTAGSPKKSPSLQSSIVLQSPPQAPSKQTQTDTCSTVESSCDASGEDNSDQDQATVRTQVQNAGSGRDEFSTATDDADDTLFNSVINMESVSTPDPVKTPINFNGFAYPGLSSVYDTARLRKQTGDTKPRQRQRREKKDRPWSVVGLQEITSKVDPSTPQPIAASESAINNLHFNTDSDSSPPSLPVLLPSQSSTFPRDHRTSHHHHHYSHQRSPADHNLSSSRSRRRLKHSDRELSRTSEGSNSHPIASTPIAAGKLTYSEASLGTEQLQRSPHKSRRQRRHKRKSSLEDRESTSLKTLTAYRSSATESYDSAEADTESETTDEYLTAPMEVPTSEGDDVHNVSGSLSENSSWDNYQMVYPTASDDANEELLAWEPHDDDLEFDDDFQLSRQRTRSIVTDALADGQQRRTKLKFTKQGVPCDDSDSDLEDFHHILDQSELQLKLVDQSLRKKRRDPMGTGLHPNPAKYSEIIVTYETNIRCLESICQHLNSEDVTPEDVKRVKDLMYQWEKVYALASERHAQTTALGSIREKMAEMKASIQEAGQYLSYDKFSSAEGLNSTIASLKEKREALERQSQQIEELRQQLTDFSSLHPTIRVDQYLNELTSLQKSTALMLFKVKEHTSGLESERSLWLEYLEGQQELDRLLAADRDRLHELLWHRDTGLRLTKKDVLTELERLQESLSVYESKLAVLGAMRARLTQASDAEAQQSLLASLADLRNQLLVVSQRCKQMYRDVEDDQDLPLYPMDTLDRDSDLGKLAMSAAALHDAFTQTPANVNGSGSPATEAATALLSSKTAPATSSASSSSSPSPATKSGLSRSCAVVLRSLPVQVVALVLVAGLAYALDPDVLDKLASFTLTITPELNHVNGPPPV